MNVEQFATTKLEEIKLKELGLIYRVKAFTYVVSSNGEIRYISKEAKTLMKNVPATDAKVEDLFPDRKQDKDRELALQAFMDGVRVFSSKVQDPEDRTMDVTLYETLVSIEREGETIEGTLGVCIISNDDVISLDDVATFIRFMFQSDVVYYLAPVSQRESNHQIAEEVIKVFESTLQYTREGDKWLSSGRGKFFEKIMFYIERSLPISFALPAFPFKSSNYAFKTTGPLPDKGEELALQKLQSFCRGVKEVYPQGAELNIVSDGSIFCDLSGVSDEEAMTYKEYLAKMTSRDEQPILFKDLGDFFDSGDTISVKRDKLLKFSCITLQKMEEKIEAEKEVTGMYYGFTRIISHEHFPFTAILDTAERNANKPANVTASKIKKVTKQLAKVALVRNEAYSTLVQELMPLHVRFSIHLYDNSGYKSSVKLSDLESTGAEAGVVDNHIPTPWHNVIVETKEGKYVAMKRYEAVKQVGEHNLVYYEPGWPSHYKQQ